eukprot:SAG22_NODE_116_length_19306_cov_247.696517_11_plen_246_part_00
MSVCCRSLCLLASYYRSLPAKTQFLQVGELERNAEREEPAKRPNERQHKGVWRVALPAVELDAVGGVPVQQRQPGAVPAADRQLPRLKGRAASAARRAGGQQGTALSQHAQFKIPVEARQRDSALLLLDSTAPVEARQKGSALRTCLVRIGLAFSHLLFCEARKPGSENSGITAGKRRKERPAVGSGQWVGPQGKARRAGAPPPTPFPAGKRTGGQYRRRTCRAGWAGWAHFFEMLSRASRLISM